MPKPGNSEAGVLYVVAKLDSPSNIWEVVDETSEKCNTMLVVTSMR